MSYQDFARVFLLLFISLLSMFGISQPSPISIRNSSLPMAILLPNLSSLNAGSHLAAAYPFTGTTYPNCVGPTVAGGSDVDYAGTPNLDASKCRTDLPNTTSAPPKSLFGQGVLQADIPPKSNKTVNATTGGETPMLPGMTSTYPEFSPRALWYRTTNNGRWPGDSNNAGYGWNNTRALYLYHHSWPSIQSGTTANLNHPGRLVLPDTVCIDTVDGTVDEVCAKDGVVTPPATLANLNVPRNSMYPSTTSSTNEPASTFAVCGVTGNSHKYQSVQARLGGTNQTDITGSTCPTTVGDPRAAIVDFMADLQSTALDPSAGTGVFKGVDPSTSGSLGTSSTLIITAQNTYTSNKVNAVNLCSLPGTVGGICPTTNGTTTRTLSGTLTLRANRNVDGNSLGPSPVFLLRASSFEDLTLKALKIRLDGVDPNNVFWMVPRVNAVTSNANALEIIADTSVSPNIPSVIVGNFIGKMPASGTANKTQATTLNIGDNVAIRSARFLGFRAIPSGSGCNPVPLTAACDGGAKGIASSAVVTAMTTVNQPVVLPVIHFHAPSAIASTSGFSVGSASTADGSINGDPTALSNTNGQWAERATDSEINAYIVAGNTPSRSYTTVPNSTPYETGETGGGLHNFVRFIENWTNVAAKVTGGFIQNTRSVFATAPFSATAPFTDLANLRTSSAIETLFLNPSAPNHALSNLDFNTSTSTDAYYRSTNAASAPFYSAPDRFWGFDVGLLTQAPDRFAERFATVVPTPNEFFREVEREDPWVKALLCAVQPATLNDTTRKGTTPASYTVPALAGQSDRPTNTTDCPTTVTYN
jgi:hypothetical protein